MRSLINVEPEPDHFFRRFAPGRSLEGSIEVAGTRWVPWPLILVEPVPPFCKYSSDPRRFFHYLEEGFIVQSLFLEIHLETRPLFDILGLTLTVRAVDGKDLVYGCPRFYQALGEGKEEPVGFN